MTVVGHREIFKIKPNMFLIFVISVIILGWWFTGIAFAEELVQDSTGDNALCASCHERASGILAHRKLKLNKLDNAACLQCHEPHTMSQNNENKLRIPEKNSCTSCHYKYSSFNFRKDDSKVRLVHQPLEKCTNCHRSHELGEKPQLVTAQDALCSSCHVNVAQKLLKNNQHEPFAAQKCTTCHNPHFSKQKKLLVAAPKQLCESCHLNREKSMNRVTSHPPYQRGQCTVCHDPHASDNIKQLVNAPEDLCFNCHVGMAGNLKKAVLHRPFGNRNCLSCHLPHASKTAKLVKGDTVDQLCYNCHGDLKEELLLQSHHPVGSYIGCTSCHEPHGTDFRKLQVIEGNELCFSCHVSKRIFYRKIEHNSMPGETFAGACLNCHKPHGSAFVPLLIEDEMNLCASCHVQMKFGYGFTHPVGESFKDPSNGKKLTCSSSCHDPHGTGNKYNVIKKEDALCLTCHTDKISK